MSHPTPQDQTATRQTTRTAVAVLAMALSVLLAGCGPATGRHATPVPVGTDRWVVESVRYHGPRGGNGPGGRGTHHVVCVPETDLGLDHADRDRTREVVIPAGRATDGTYLPEGTACPAGPAPTP